MEAKQDRNDDVSDNNTPLISSFCEITSSSREEAAFFLESHQWNLDAAVSTFLDNNFNNNNIIDDDEQAAVDSALLNSQTARAAVNTVSPTDSRSPAYSPSHSPSRSRSRSISPEVVPSRAPYRLRSRDKAPAAGASRRQTRGGIRTLDDLNREAEAADDDEDDNDDDDDEAQEYYTGGERSGMLVRDPTKPFDVDSMFEQAKAGAVERPADLHRASSSSRSFTGRGRLLSGETVEAAPQPPEAVTHTVTLWRNGFTVDDGPLRSFDDPANASFLEYIKRSRCPEELAPADRKTKVHIDLVRRDENYRLTVPEPKVSFQGVGRTLGSNSSETTSEPNFEALPVQGITVDSSLPTTSIQLRLADGTRMVAQFNLHHTVGDIRGFINSSRPGGQTEYQLQAMGFPPKQLSDANETIEKAGIANSVVIQKF